MVNRALITGATGLLGRTVLDAFESAGWEAIGTGFSRAKPPQIRKVDILNADEVDALLDEVRPQVVVHCAADRKPDSCTANPDAARSLNVQATSQLAQSTSSRSIFLIYISTDYVFPGRKGEAPYSASFPPSPTNIYGETKFQGEKAVLEICNNDTTKGNTIPGAVVLRVPVLYGETVPKENNAESAVNVLMDALWKSQKEKVVMDDYAIRYPTNTADVGRVCVDVAKVYLATTSTTSDTNAKALPRILQFSSEDRMTKYEICQIFGDTMGLPVDGIVADKESGARPGPDGTMRPYDCHLSNDELKKLGVDVSTVDFGMWWRKWVGAIRH